MSVSVIALAGLGFASLLLFKRRKPMEPATAIQPTPKGSGRDIATLVQQDIEARAVIGEKKYGERLKAFNGRSSLVDAYQEVLDLAVYLRAKIEEELK